MNVSRIPKYFIRRPALFWSLAVLGVIIGIYSFVTMPKLEDPPVPVKQAMVAISCPGADAHTMELKVASLMEDRLRALPDVDNIRSECTPGLALVTVEFKMSVLEKDLEQHFDLLRRKVADSRAYLPSDCYDPVVLDDLMDVYGILYSFGGRGYTYPEMDRYARMVRRELLSVPGVKRINIAGGRDEVIEILISKEQIAANGLLPMQIMLSLQGAGKIANAGKATIGDDRLGILVGGELEDEQDIADMLLRTPDGKISRLGDIALVRRVGAEPQTGGLFVNGVPSLALCVAMENNVVVPDVGKAVDARLAEVMQRVPAGIEVGKIFFQPDMVNRAIGGFMLNLLESVLIVILVLIFAMGLRSGLIIGLGLVLTIAISFPVLLMMDSTLQRISLGAFIVAMGMLVDNSIVIMDGILVDKRRGLPSDKYLFRTGNHTAIPLLAATVIAVSTFLCVYLSPDSAGEYCRDMFLVLCVSLLVSWVVALIQVPVCSAQWIDENTPEGKGERADRKILGAVRRVVAFAVAHKWASLAVAVVLLLGSTAGLAGAKILFFPDFDYNQFVIEYFLPDQTSPDKVREDLLALTDVLLEDERVEKVTASMGSAPARYCLVRPMTNGGESYGELMVDCKDFKTASKLIADFRPRLRSQCPDAYIRFRRYNFSISTSHPFEVHFHGPDPAVLRELSARAEQIMLDCPIVDPYSVSNNWHPKGKTIVADYVQRDALASGLGRGDVANALLAATDGMPVGVIHDQDKMVLVKMAVRSDDGSRISDLVDIPVWGSLGSGLDKETLGGLMTGAVSVEDLGDELMESVSLGSIVPRLETRWSEDYILRVNGERTIEAQCDPNPDEYFGTATMIAMRLAPKMAAIELPEGYSMEIGGEVHLLSTALVNIIKYLPVSLVLILLILLLLFGTWKRLLLIVCCLPFVLCGITPALLLLRQPFTFMGMIGIIGLIGMMVKNGIVLVDEIIRLQGEEGQSPYDAVLNATVSRVRPVILASLTTILGMLPLLGDPMYGSLSLVIMSGLMIGTLITLVLLPVLYSLFFHVNTKKNEN